MDCPELEPKAAGPGPMPGKPVPVVPLVAPLMPGRLGTGSSRTGSPRWARKWLARVSSAGMLLAGGRRSVLAQTGFCQLRHFSEVFGVLRRRSRRRTGGCCRRHRPQLFLPFPFLGTFVISISTLSAFAAGPLARPSCLDCPAVACGWLPSCRVSASK